MMMYLKVHKTEKGEMIALCDQEVLGKVLKEGKKEMDLKTYSDFYKGALVDKKQASATINAAQIYSANVVGEESVELLVEIGIVDREQIMKIGNVPFVHIYTLI